MSDSGSVSLEKFLSDELVQQYQQIKCPQCNKILKYAVQIESCRHSLCRPCAEALIYVAQIDGKTEAICPQKDCDGLVQKRCLFDNVALREEVNRFLVAVMECRIGDCAWRGHIRDYQDHYTDTHLFLVQELPGKGVTSVSQHRISLQVGADVKSKVSFDSGIASFSCFEQANQPMVVLEDVSKNELHLESIPDSESTDRMGEVSQLVSGSAGFSSLVPLHNTPTQHGLQVAKQVVSLQAIPHDPHQQPLVDKVSSLHNALGKRHQLSALKQGQKSHYRSFSLPPIPVKGMQPLMEMVKTSLQKSDRRSRRISLTIPLLSADASAPRKRPTSAKAKCFPSPTRKRLPPLKPPSVSSEQKSTSGECMDCKYKDFEIQRLEAELKKFGV